MGVGRNEHHVGRSLPWYFVLLVAVWSSVCRNGASSTYVTSEYIEDYEVLELDHLDLLNRHTRVKRALDSHFVWAFRAYGRKFSVRLYPAGSVFAENHMMDFGDGGPRPVDTSFIYDGYLTDQAGSSAHLSIRQGGVSGYVKVLGDTTYHIEPARNHFKNAKFHTIIYPESKMNLDPFKHLRSASCGTRDARFNTKTNRSLSLEEFDMSSQFFTRYQDGAKRQKRQASSNNVLNPETARCAMYLRADKLLYKHIFDQHSDNSGLTKEEQTREEILALFANLVTFLTDTYKNVQFSTPGGTSYAQGVNFQIQKTTIITSCGTGSGDWGSGYCTDNLDVNHFLELTAQDNQDEFCLTYTFTYRDFLDGVVGLAYLGSPDSSAAGICGRFSRTRVADGSLIWISQNVGIVSLVNFQRDVPIVISKLTFAHEVGHNFGAQHDAANSQCAPYQTQFPGAAQGNYIMFPSTTQGSLANNFLFSECSKENIYDVLSSFTPNGQKYNCFEASNTTVCGNTVKEAGEECDCGYEEDCGNIDQCCVPRSQDGTTGCTMQNSTVCSPSSGPCCSSACTYLKDTVLCRPQTECMDSAYCNGTSSECPASTIAEDYQTFCNNYTATCLDGNCIGSICKKIGWDECYQSDAEVSTVSQTCYISCQNNDTGDCITTLDTNMYNSIFGNDSVNVNPDGSSGVIQPPGSSCNSFQGYCDSQAICQSIDPDGPFRRLLGDVFDEERWKDIRDWMKDHWWAVLLACVGAVASLVLFMRIFSYHTPEHDPKRPPPLRAPDRVRGNQSRPHRTDQYAMERPKPTRGANRPTNDRRPHGHSSRHADDQINGHPRSPRKRSERSNRPDINGSASGPRPSSDIWGRSTSLDPKGHQNFTDIRDRGLKGRSLYDDTYQGYRPMGSPPSYPPPQPPSSPPPSYLQQRDRINDHRSRSHNFDQQPIMNSLHSPPSSNPYNNRVQPPPYRPTSHSDSYSYEPFDFNNVNYYRRH